MRAIRSDRQIAGQPLTVSASSPVGANCAARGAAPRLPGASRTRQRRPQLRRATARRPAGVMTRCHSGGRGGGATDTAAAGAARLAALSSTKRAVEMSATRRPRSFTRQLWSSVRTGGGTSAGSGVPVRFEAHHRAEHLRHVLALEGAAAASASRTAHSRTPRCRCAGRPRAPWPARGSCRPPCRESCRAGHPRRRVIVGDAVTSRRLRRLRLGQPWPARSPAPSRRRRRAP